MKKNILRILMGVFQRKTYSSLDLKTTFLDRCLTTLDLTALGVGGTLGAGVYVVTGKVAKDVAGPGVLISFVIAALASILSGLCYAEFGSRVPRAGSAYVYSYVTIGELMAFVIGWNLILEYVIGTASVSRAWSANLDEVTGGHIKQFFNSTMPMTLSWLAPYPDFLAFLITITVTIILSVGVKESSRFNNIFTVLNVAVILFSIICGFWNANIKNWKINPHQINDTNFNIGQGYFFPFGISGVLSGAATCFYAFVGFDTISTSGEETLTPQKSIPIAIITCLLSCFVAYAGVSSIITLMCPYYLINPDAPLPFIFDKIGWPVAKYIVGIGAIFGLSTSLVGSLFPLPRVIYAMSSDGLIFKFLSRINNRFKTPLIATLLAGFFSACMSTIFDLKSLVEMMSIGTLLAYTLVAFSIVMLRFSNITITKDEKKSEEESEYLFIEINLRNYLKHLFRRQSEFPTNLTSKISKINSYFLLISIFILDLLLLQDTHFNSPILLFFIVLFGVIVLLLCITLQIQPENQSKISFKVPGVPWLPMISMMINIYLMMKLPSETWYRFAIWMVLGFLMYFCYGIFHSEERKKKLNSEEDLLLDH